MPMTGGWSGGTTCLQALEMARNDINARVDVLGGFDIKLDYVNSGVRHNASFSDFKTIK